MASINTGWWLNLFIYLFIIYRSSEWEENEPLGTFMFTLYSLYGCKRCGISVSAVHHRKTETKRLF